MTAFRIPLAAALVAALAAGTAFAEPGHGKGRGHDDDRDPVVQHRIVERHVVVPDDRGHAGCPPGLAKKHNGCLPPGQAKKLAIGQPVPAGAVYVIPRHVMVQLPPAPVGHRYAIVDNQVVLVSNHYVVINIIHGLLG
ncbi:MAG TPA: hypothetical protein VLK85_17350 [Ramlibacter sp.]|nr:hypothetical protein [Ramlibacter sp.]